MISKFSLKIKQILGDGYLYSLIYRIVYFLKVFFIIKPNISKSLKSNSIELIHVNEERPLVVVPLLETNHYMHLHILAMAKAFSLRGYDILVIVCDEYLPACEIKNCRMSQSLNPCFKCTTNRSLLTKSFGLRTLTLSSIFSDIEDPVGYGKKTFEDYSLDVEKFDLIVEDSVTRHFYGAEMSFDPKEVSKIRAGHKETAYISLALGEILLKEYSPSICFNIMMVYTAWGPLIDLFESAGIAPITLSMTQFNFNAIRLNNADLFRHKRTYQRFLDNRGNIGLSNDESKALDSFLINRKTGNDDLMKEWNYFQDSSVEDLGINKDKKNVFLFTNLPWDQGLGEFAGIFDDVLDWVYKTIEHFKYDEEIDIWIKPHPVEVRGPAKSGKTVTEFISTEYQELPDNIHIINADDGINTYSLYKHIDVGVVLTGTIGLEMALDGIPVVSAGVNPCYGLGILSEPGTESDYYKAITSDSNLIDDMNDLRLFSYFYFIHQCLKWPLTKRSHGDNFTDYEFSSSDDLKTGNMEDLDIIFDEIENLVEDFNANHKK